MKLYIGNDIQSINEFQKLVNKQNNYLLNKIFNKEEIQYCLKKQNPIQHLAGKFSAKEATQKAFSQIIKLTPLNIIIKNDKNNKPYIKFNDKIKTQIKKQINTKKITLSISHSENYATAIVAYLEEKNIIEGYEKPLILKDEQNEVT